MEKATLRDMRSRNGKLLAVVIRDEKGAELDCTFFNGHKLKSLVKPGVRAVFSGKVGVFNEKLQLTHPQFETLDEDDEIRPFISVYPATGKLGSQVIARSVRQVLDMLDDVADPLPSSVRERESLAELEPGAAPHPPAREPERHLRRPPPAGVGRGDGRAARARAAPPRPRPPGPPPRARPAPGRPRWRRSTPGCRSRSPPASRRSARRSPPTSPGGTR